MYLETLKQLLIGYIQVGVFVCGFVMLIYYATWWLMANHPEWTSATADDAEKNIKYMEGEFKRGKILRYTIIWPVVFYRIIRALVKPNAYE